MTIQLIQDQGWFHFCGTFPATGLRRNLASLVSGMTVNEVIIMAGRFTL